MSGAFRVSRKRRRRWCRVQVKVKEQEEVNDRWKEVSESKLKGLEGLDVKWDSEKAGQKQ